MSFSGNIYIENVDSNNNIDVSIPQYILNLLTGNVSLNSDVSFNGKNIVVNSECSFLQVRTTHSPTRQMTERQRHR
jgi:azurin